jgi:hypothetical protein
LSWNISLCDLEQSYILSFLGRSSSNKDLLKQSKITYFKDPLMLSPQDLYRLSKVLVQNFLKKRFLIFFQCRSSFFWESFILCELYRKLDYHSISPCFQAFQTSKSPWKRLELSNGAFVYSVKIGLSDFHDFNPPGQNLPLHHFSHFSLFFSQEL